MTTLKSDVFATPQAAVPLAFDPDLVRKYDQAGPRYTSYPTADRFNEAFGPADYVQALITRRETRPHDPLSLYVHVPFCNTLCFYCACNKVITKDHGRSAKYIRYLGREIAMVSGLIEGAPQVAQLHCGGGTPTFLARDEMEALMGMLRKAFAFQENAEISTVTSIIRDLSAARTTVRTVKILSPLLMRRTPRSASAPSTRAMTSGSSTPISGFVPATTLSTRPSSFSALVGSPTSNTAPISRKPMGSAIQSAY